MGLDLHKAFIQWSLIDVHGDETANERIASEAADLTKLIDKLTAEGEALQVVLEACGCFMWVYDLLVEKLGKAKVHVAAPSKVRAIADSKEKNDENDAWWLAYLLYECRLPEAFVAEGDLRDLRVASRECRTVVDQRSDLMRQMRSHLLQLGMKLPRNAWSSRDGRVKVERMLEQLSDHRMRGVLIRRLWGRIQTMDEEVAYWNEQVKKLSKVFDEVVLLAQQLPGVGPVVSAAVWSELGDPGRYHSAKAYAKATGLTPGYRESGGKRVGKPKITREGSAHVRWALTRAIVSCQRCKSGPGLAVKQWTERMSKRKAKKAVYVAAARKLAEGIWRLFALGEAFDLARAFGGGSSRRGKPSRSSRAAALGGT